MRSSVAVGSKEKYNDQPVKQTKQLTSAVDVVILVPPEAPTTSLTRPSLSTTTLGHMDDSGLFPGFMKFAADAGTPK